MMGYSFLPSDRAALLSRLTHQDDSERADTILGATRETGGTFTLTRTTQGRDVWLIILHGISAKGANQANAVRNWIQQANTAERTEGAPL